MVAEQPPATRPLRLLVVDDEAPIRLVMTLYLRHRGHIVDEACDGAGALRLLQQQPYDVILSDLRMPGFDGCALLEEIRSRQLAGQVIFMTGDAADPDDFPGVEDVPVLLKPISLDNVATAVEEAARKAA